MTMPATQPLSGKPADEAVPPLRDGDRLTRVEFERRYAAMPQLKKAELIEGVVHVASPTRHRSHGRPNAQIIAWLGTYEAATPGVEAGTNCTARLDLGNEPQPDGLLLIAPECGGQATISASDFIEAAPELVAEVAASSVDYDLGTKLNAYRRNSVREYIVWRVLEGAIDWFVLRGDSLDRLDAGDDGIYRSEVFPGLWLDPAALLRDDLAAVLAVLQRGIATAEHAAFVARLKPG